MLEAEARNGFFQTQDQEPDFDFLFLQGDLEKKRRNVTEEEEEEEEDYINVKEWRNYCLIVRWYYLANSPLSNYCLRLKLRWAIS